MGACRRPGTPGLEPVVLCQGWVIHLDELEIAWSRPPLGCWALSDYWTAYLSGLLWGKQVFYLPLGSFHPLSRESFTDFCASFLPWLAGCCHAHSLSVGLWGHSPRSMEGNPMKVLPWLYNNCIAQTRSYFKRFSCSLNCKYNPLIHSGTIGKGLESVPDLAYRAWLFSSSCRDSKF